MNRGYKLLWRNIWTNPLPRESGKKFSNLEAWLYIINVLADGMYDESTELKRWGFRGEHSLPLRVPGNQNQ